MTVKGYLDTFRKTAMQVIDECDDIVADKMSTDARKGQLLAGVFTKYGLLD